ncbi:hypothetical protein [Streptomyces sp. NPDC029003]|uniref:hypothetical protein n=1 Tax=Streptomyces sp. NPDC029003 TaxID=3155125 RepID=UPI003410F061
MTEAVIAGPFPLPAPKECQEQWIEAVLATDGVNLPRGALENVAPFIADPAETLGDPDFQGIRRLKATAVRRIRTDAGEMLVAVVRMHGVGGVLWGHNERISSIWRSVADPTVAQGTEKALASVRPWSRTDDEGHEQFLAALESSAPNRQALIMDAEDAADALLKYDRLRKYDLGEDLVLNGQQEPGMYVPQYIRLQDDPEVDSEGNRLYPDAYWGWMAVRGNNRTQKRQSIFRLTSGEVLAGVPAEKLGRTEGGVVCDPQVWLAEFSTLLNREFAASEEDLDPKTGARAHRAAAIAVVEAHLVVGTPTPQRLYRIVQMSNRRDHVNPPLEFDAVGRSRALGRGVLGMYVARRLMDEKSAEVLSGLAPIRELPAATADMTVSELRDKRSMALLQTLFPTDPLKRHLLQRALSENPPSQLKAAEIHQRARAWSALTSESYPRPWNPRIAEIFTTKIRDGVTLSERPLPELLAAADTDPDAFEELVAYRAVHWLAAFSLVEPDRGSLDGQEAIDDAGARVTRERRTVTNVLQALRHERKRMMAVGVLRSLVAAMDDGDRRPWRVSSNGVELQGREMTPLWFDMEFPKELGTRPRNTPARRPTPVPPSTPPSTPPPTPAPAHVSAPAPLSIPAPAVPHGVPSVPGAVGVASALSRTGTAPAGVPVGAASGDALWARAEELIQGMSEGSAELRQTLGQLLDRAGSPPLGRGRADAAVRRINQTVARLRELPELVEMLAEQEPR